MARNDELLKKMRAGNFVANNGQVLRDINILRHQYVELKSVRRVRSAEMGEQEFLDCVNYLQQKGYIRLRTVQDKKVMELADADYTLLEAIVTDLGIDLLGGAIENPMVDV